MNDLTQVIKSIRLTEKATLGTETSNSYTFKVDRNANKLDIKRAVEQLLGKKVVSVNTCNYFGKAKRQRRADAGRTAHWKKAVVRLAKGETIDLV